MSLETLIEAAKFLEHKEDKKKPDDLKYKSIQSSETISSSKSDIHFQANRASSSNEIKDIRMHASEIQISSFHHPSTSINNESHHDVAETKKSNNRQNSNIPQSIVYDASSADLSNNSCNQSDTQAITAATSSYQVKSVSKNTTKSLLLTPESVSESFDENKVSMASNMDPLFARASAAVKSSAFFNQKEGVLIRSPRTIPPTGLTLPPQGVAIDPRSFSSNGATLGLQLKQSYFPINTGLPSAGHVSVLSNQNKLTATTSSDRTVSIMPSLKPVVDSKTYAALQIKPMKRSVTLTHNQLEKNRRAHLKECFEELKKAIPRLGMRRSSNLTILKAALRQIQTLKRKSVTHQQILSRLVKERDEKRSKEIKLMKELLNFADRKSIEKVVTEIIRNGVKHSPPATSSIYDNSQMSTTTASEAEEEEYRGYGEVLFQPVSSSQHAIAESRGHFHPTAPHLIVSPQHLEDKKVALIRSTSSSPICEPYGELCIVESPQDPSRNISSPKTPQTSISSQPHQRVPGSHKPAIYSNDKPIFVPKRSPIKSQPPRRSVTPTPSSDFVRFFPGFSAGSGGSPPLMSSHHFEFSGEDVNNDKELTQKGPTSKRTHQSASLPPATCALNLAPSSSHSSNIKSTLEETSDVSKRHDAAVGPSVESNASNQLSRPKPQHILATTADTVLVTSYPGYEVKLKYLSTAASSMTTSFDKTSQARIPMKKRTLNIDSFTRAPAHDTKTTPPSISSFDHQMTSLYVGASAAVLDSSSGGKMMSTSDHESDREPPYLERKKAKIPHWRKSLLNEQAAASEGRVKVKKKTFQVHQYEIYDPKTTSSGRGPNESKRKTTTFNLWDRKHHAITPTSSRNWRGKQQLITSKPKVNASSSIAHSSTETPSARPLSGGGNLTTVSYSLLQKTSKPAVPASLLATPPRTASTVDGASKQSTFSLQEDSKPVPSVVTSPSTPVGVLPVPSQRLHALNTVPFQLPANPIGYHIVPSPATVPISPARSSSGSDILMSSKPPLTNALPRASSVELTKNSKDAFTLLQPNSGQANSLQLSQLPCILPLNYVMYPPGVPTNGMHLATLPQHPPKVMTSNSLTSVPMGAARLPSKRPGSPPAPPKPPSRNQSNESTSSTTLSADSVDFESHKSATNPKKARLAEQRLTPQPVILPQHGSRFAQSQFFLPGNASGFMVAAPSTNGFGSPFNLFGYPLQAYAGTQSYLQAVPMALPGGISPMWPVNPAVLPTVDGASSTVVSASSASRNQLLASPALQNSKVD